MNPPAGEERARDRLVSHRGQMEFGSPKRPKAVEALVIHHLDDLDAKVNAFSESIEGSQENDYKGGRSRQW